MTLSFIRVFFLMVSGIVGYYIGMLLFEPLLGAEIGLLAALLMIFLETRLRRVSVRGLSSMVFGLLLGVFMAKLLADVIEMSQPGPFIMSVTRIVLTVMFSYLGAVMALRGKDEFNIIIPYVRFRRQDVKEGIILLDTSAIIDGRIADIYKLNFLIGRLVVPRFVLQELQRLADSSDDIKRQRGRRGLELLRLMQNDPKVDVHIHEDEMTDEQDVDAKLVSLAKVMDARVCTTDFNLSQSASLRDVEILNVNELANAVKSVIFIGEELKIKLVKEGKEPTQAVGYLEDGTMVVVSDGRRLIGQLVKTVVTSVLQTQSGKMIFARTAKE